MVRAAGDRDGPYAGGPSNGHPRRQRSTTEPDPLLVLTGPLGGHRVVDQRDELLEVDKVCDVVVVAPSLTEPCWTSPTDARATSRGRTSRLVPPAPAWGGRPRWSSRRAREDPRVGERKRPRGLLRRPHQPGRPRCVRRRALTPLSRRDSRPPREAAGCSRLRRSGAVMSAINLLAEGRANSLTGEKCSRAPQLDAVFTNGGAHRRSARRMTHRVMG
jgi:hypothetical protein